jgi:hypothetical protein
MSILMDANHNLILIEAMFRRNTTTDLTKSKKASQAAQLQVNVAGPSPRFKRSLSFSEAAVHGQPLHLVLEERLLTEKRQCDMELRMFVAQALDPLQTELLANENALKAVKRLIKLINRMLALSSEQMRSTDQPCQKIIAKLRKLQTRWLPSWPGKSSITK